MELKYKDTLMNVSQAALGYTGGQFAIWTNDIGAVSNGSLNTRVWHGVHNFCAVVQGQTASARIGRKFTIKSIRLDMGFNFVAIESFKLTVAMRVVLVWDKQCNGSIVQAGDIFESTVLAGPLAGNIGAAPPVNPGIVAINALPNVSNSQRFRILLDKTYNYELGSNTVAPAADANGSSMDRMINIYKKMNMEIESSTTDAAVQGLRSNNVSLWICCNQTNGVAAGGVVQDSTTNAMSFNPYGWARIRYTDA